MYVGCMRLGEVSAKKCQYILKLIIVVSALRDRSFLVRLLDLLDKSQSTTMAEAHVYSESKADAHMTHSHNA